MFPVRKGPGMIGLVVVGLLLLPLVAAAQEATMSGSVTDSTGGVLPGVTVTAADIEAQSSVRARQFRLCAGLDATARILK